MVDLVGAESKSKYYRVREFVTKGVLYLILTLGAIIAIIPFLWMLQTSFKTYGEHGQRVFWPAALSPAPYADRPASSTVTVGVEPTDRWQNAPRSFSPLVEGQISIDQVSPFLREEIMREEDVSVPFNVLILGIDTTDDGVQNYDNFMLTVDTPVIGQFTTRLSQGELGGPNIAGTRGRWGPHLRVRETTPESFTVQVKWSTVRMFSHNYIQAWTEADFSQYMWNSVRITLLTVAGVVVTGTLAAYAFARMRFPGKNVLFTLYLATYMIPGAVTLIPNYLIIVGLERFFIDTFGIENAWFDNWTALTIPFMVNAFSVFLLRQFFAQIPDDLFDAALIDGAGHFRFLTQIVVPLSKAPLMSVIIFNGIWAWNSLQWPLIVTTTDRWLPVTVGLTSFITEAAAETQLIMAGAVITTIPILVLYFFTQRTFTEGIATTGLKG
jgi:ABC-type glycerol-3-phosphate transport system permease component